MYRFEKDKELIDAALDIFSNNGLSIRVDKNTLKPEDCSASATCHDCLFNCTDKIEGDCSTGWLQWLLEEVEDESMDKCKDCTHLEDKGEYYTKCDWCQDCYWSKSKLLNYAPINPSELPVSMCHDCKHLHEGDNDEYCNDCLVLCTDNFKKKEMSPNKAIDVLIKQTVESEELKEAYTVAIKTLKEKYDNETSK